VGCVDMGVCVLEASFINMQRHAKEEMYSQIGGYLVLLVQIQMSKTDAEKY